MQDRTLSATFHVATPMFLGDADQNAASLRCQSIKGELAFWWRALHFADYVAKTDGIIPNALKQMHTDEQILFGGSNRQSSFLLTTRWLDQPAILSADKGTVLSERKSVPVGPGARYLGYGLMHAFSSGKTGRRAGELTRSCFRHGSRFEVKLVWRPLPKGEHRDQPSPQHEGTLRHGLLRALKVMGLLGGLGSRKRRGWGSIALEHVNLYGEKHEGPRTADEFKAALKTEVGNLSLSGTDFPITTFAQETDIRIGNFKHANPLVVLNALGSGFLKYRAWGNPKGNVGGVQVDASFVKDHDWYQKCAEFSRDRGNYVPMRTAFGLPHNYNSQSFGVTSGLCDSDRRGSPLIFHIHPLEEGYVAVSSFFPNLFLPGDVAVWEKASGQNQKKNKTNKPYVFDPSVIQHFLDGIKHDDRGGAVKASAPYFANTKVWP